MPVPANIWATAGHYSVIGLLPDDHTYAKGSLFIIKPGTKAVVFDVDGMPAFCLHVAYGRMLGTARVVRAIAGIAAVSMCPEQVATGY